jgi:hypothetical protein
MFAPDCKFYRLEDALDCAERELKRRKSVYPAMVTQGKISQDKATWEIDHMQYIIDIINGRIHAHQGYRK